MKQTKIYSIKSRPYIPEDNQLIDFSELTTASSNEFKLLDEEVLELNRFLHDRGEGGWSRDLN